MTSHGNSSGRGLVLGRYDYALFQSLFAYSAISIVVPVALVALSRDLGFDLSEGGLSKGGALQLGRTLFLMITLLICPVLAGRWGKRRSMGMAVLLMGMGGLLCSWTPGYLLLFLALLVAGMGEGVVEGLITPFVQDLHPQEPGRYINFAHAFWPIGVMSTVLVSGGLLSMGVSWRLIIAGISLLAFIAAALLLWPASPSNPHPEHTEPVHWKTVCGHAMAILRIRRFWLFFAAMFLAGGAEFCLTFWSASYIQLNFGATAWSGGIGTACFAGGMVLGRTGWGVFIKQRQLKQLVFFSAFFGAAITVPFPTLTHLQVLFGLLFLSGLAIAPFWPSIQSYCADRIPEADKTMLFVLLSCSGVPGCGFFAWLMGIIGNRTGDLSTAFYLVPLCLVSLAAVIGIDWWYAVQPHRHNRA